jgi:4-amino-4-deoxy-L-arabinose transferase-like glycosyltransferase
LSAAGFLKKGTTDLARVCFTEVLSRKRTRKAEFVFILILLLLSLTLFFFQLGTRPLWDIDEGMHAATSRDMVLSGDWITPQLNGENFYDKPVLFTWFAAISFLVFGFTEFAARLPAAMLGLGCVLATYLFGRRTFGPTVGFLGAAILATNIEFVILSRVVVHDIALVFFVTLALFFFYMGFSRKRQRKIYLLLFYVSAGFAVLTKGPIGVLLPVLVIGLFLMVRRKLSFLKEMEIAWGIPLFLAIAAPWYVLISFKNRDYAGYFFIQQNLMNFISLTQEVRHPKPLYFYVYILLGGFFPWSLFLPLAIVRAIREGLKGMSDGTVFLLVWLGAIFLFFSAASSKLAPYILPVFPAASLLVGILMCELLEAPTRGLRRGFLFSSILLPVSVLVGLLHTLLNPPTLLEYNFGIDLTHVNSLLIFIAAGATAACFLFLAKHYRAFFSMVVGIVVSSMVICIVYVVPSIDPYRSTKGLARELDMMLPPGGKLVFFDDLRDSTLFYTNRRAIVLRYPQQLLDYFATDRRVFCVIDREDFEKFDSLRYTTYVLGMEGRKLLVSNRQSS